MCRVGDVAQALADAAFLDGPIAIRQGRDLAATGEQLRSVPRGRETRARRAGRRRLCLGRARGRTLRDLGRGLLGDAPLARRAAADADGLGRLVSHGAAAFASRSRCARCVGRRGGRRRARARCAESVSASRRLARSSTRGDQRVPTRSRPGSRRRVPSPRPRRRQHRAPRRGPFRSAAVKRVRTWPIALRDGSPMPTRRRANFWVPISPTIERMPLCVPALPCSRMRSLPSGRSKSSYDDEQVLERRALAGEHLAHGDARTRSCRSWA